MLPFYCYKILIFLYLLSPADSAAVLLQVMLLMLLTFAVTVAVLLFVAACGCYGFLQQQLCLEFAVDVAVVASAVGNICR